MDKPEGPTSHDVVARARRLFGTRAIGHTGTLDPFATGLLVLVLGGATRLARWAERHPKGYHALIRLGITTSTDDRTGAVLADRGALEWPSRGAVEQALAGFVGPQLQRPPAYSAKRVQGERSHRLARRGAAPQPAPAAVEVHRLELVAYEPPLLRVAALVGPGTYLRALARDLGERLGTGAHLVALRRIRSGAFGEESAVSWEDVPVRGRDALVPMASLLPDLPAVTVTDEGQSALRFGRGLA
ncbi:MAG TPA: tRNA pseudouridine(55) synthase TruB, partial [Gemmatimonadales bacterium]|nr:tRNA pseudouridine(55) synthase TruB [Gemmatimonadales bacterium]